MEIDSPQKGYGLCKCGYIIKQMGEFWFHVLPSADEFCHEPKPVKMETDRVKGDLL